MDKVHAAFNVVRGAHWPDWLAGTFDNDRRLFYGVFFFYGRRNQRLARRVVGAHIHFALYVP